MDDSDRVALLRQALAAVHASLIMRKGAEHMPAEMALMERALAATRGHDDECAHGSLRVVPDVRGRLVHVCAHCNVEV